MLECPRCHRLVSESARFCESCGASLSDSSVTSELTQRIRALVADGQKIEAIRVLREATGVGLAEAKHLVEITAEVVPIRELPEGDFERELLELLRSGNKIEAIKRHRERTQLGLKESKDAVEQLAARHGIAPQRAGCAGVLLAFITFLGCATVYLRGS